MFRNSALAGLAALLVVLTATGGAAVAAEFRLDRSATPVNGDLYISGGSVEVSGAVSGDVLAAGGDVLVLAPVGGDAMVAGGFVRLAERITGDLRAAGGTVTLSGRVGEEAMIAGGEVRVRGDIQGNAWISGGDIRVSGRIGGDLTVNGGEVWLDGVVAGDVMARAGELHLGPNAAIIGNLTYRAPEAAEIAAGATIGGATVYETMHMDRPDVRDMAWGVAAVGLFGWAMLALSGVVLVLLLPAGMAAVERRIQDGRARALGVGFITLVVVPAAAVVALALVLTVPLGLALLALYPVLLLLAYLAGAYWSGERVVSLFSRRRTPDFPGFSRGRAVLAMVVGVTVLTVIGLVPVVGWLLVAAAGLAGLGGWSLALLASLRRGAL